MSGLSPVAPVLALIHTCACSCFNRLKRMVFNFDTMVEEKLHSTFRFDKTLNIADFANSEIPRSQSASDNPEPGQSDATASASPPGDEGANSGDGKEQESVGQDSAASMMNTPRSVEYQREGEEGGAAPPSSGPSSDFYEYNLSGIVCHTGMTARAGHYFSFIRDRTTGAWNEFNDSVVKPFDYDREVEPRCFGGKVDPTDPRHSTVRCTAAMVVLVCGCVLCVAATHADSKCWLRRVKQMTMGNALEVPTS